ncbi:MAG: hypothetical protein ACJA16_003146 [Akkermansiaceae bacterium]
MILDFGFWILNFEFFRKRGLDFGLQNSLTRSHPKFKDPLRVGSHDAKVDKVPPKIAGMRSCRVFLGFFSSRINPLCFLIFSGGVIPKESRRFSCEKSCPQPQNSERRKQREPNPVGRPKRAGRPKESKIEEL